MYSPRKRLYILLLSKVYIWTKVNKIENKDEYTLIFSLFPYFLLFPSLQCTLDYMYVPQLSLCPTFPCQIDGVCLRLLCPLVFSVPYFPLSLVLSLFPVSRSLQCPLLFSLTQFPLFFSPCASIFTVPLFPIFQCPLVSLSHQFPVSPRQHGSQLTLSPCFQCSLISTLPCFQCPLHRLSLFPMVPRFHLLCSSVPLFSSSHSLQIFILSLCFSFQCPLLFSPNQFPLSPFPMFPSFLYPLITLSQSFPFSVASSILQIACLQLTLSPFFHPTQIEMFSLFPVFQKGCPQFSLSSHFLLDLPTVSVCLLVPQFAASPRFFVPQFPVRTLQWSNYRLLELSFFWAKIHTDCVRCASR